jgi:hypothetical protein
VNRAGVRDTPLSTSPFALPLSDAPAEALVLAPASAAVGAHQVQAAAPIKAGRHSLVEGGQRLTRRGYRRRRTSTPA